MSQLSSLCFDNSELGLQFSYPSSLTLCVEDGDPSNGVLKGIRLVGAKGEIFIKVSLQQLDVLQENHTSPIFDRIAKKIQIHTGTPTRRGSSKLLYVSPSQIACQTTHVNCGDRIFSIYLLCMNQMMYHCNISYKEVDVEFIGMWEKILSSFSFFQPALEPATIPSVVWAHYYNIENHYHILYPYDWRVEEVEVAKDKTNAIRTSSFSYSANDVDINVMIIKESVPGDVTFREYYQMCKRQFQKCNIPLTSVTAQDVLFSSMEAKQFFYSPQPGIDIFRRFTVYHNEALTITCESKNNQTLQIGPVLERMMDSFKRTQGSERSLESFLYFEHFEEKISIEFPAFLQHSHDESLLNVSDGNSALFSVHCTPQPEHHLLSNLQDIKKEIVSGYPDSMKEIKTEEFFISELQANGLEFTYSDDDQIRTMRIAIRVEKLFLWHFTKPHSVEASWGLPLLSSLHFLQ